MVYGVYLYNIGVKQRCIVLLYKLGVIVSWTTLIKIYKELEGISRVYDFTFDNFNKVTQALQAGGRT